MLREFSLTVNQFLDPNNEYHLKILSLITALNDLTIINNLQLFHKDIISSKYYFLKMNIGHLTEALKLLYVCFKDDDNRKELEKIAGLKELYREILDVNGGDKKDSFSYKVLRESRDSLFHYPREKKNFLIIKELLLEMVEKDLPLTFSLGDKKKENYYEFAEVLQLSSFATFGERYGLDIEELFKITGLLTAKVIQLLDLIVHDYFDKNNSIKCILNDNGSGSTRFV